MEPKLRLYKNWGRKNKSLNKEVINRHNNQSRGEKVEKKERKRKKEWDVGDMLDLWLQHL